MFKVEQWELSSALEMSQQSIALLGRQRGLQFEAFEREPDALARLSQT